MAGKVEDAGEKIGGARKDWRDRMMTVADVDDMTAAEAVTLITKERAFPVPDWAARRDAGADPVVLAQLKVMRDALAAKPHVIRRGIEPRVAARLYVEECTFLSDLFARTHTQDDVRGMEAACVERHGWNLLANKMNPLVVQAMFGIARPGSRSYPIGNNHKVRDAARVLISQGWPEEVPSWRKGYDVIPLRTDQFIIRKSRRTVSPILPSAEAAEAWLRERAIRAKGTADENGPREPSRPYLDSLHRTGHRLVDAKGLSPEAFIERFGFRAVEFGEWLPDGERRDVLDRAVEAFEDLAWVLKVPPHALGLGGELAVAFGARGQGHAAAHYEPGRKVLNLTRIRGAGVLAHEYFHGLDHWLGRLGTGRELEANAPAYASGGRSHWKASREATLANLPEVGATIDRLLKTIERRPHTAEETEKYMESFRRSLNNRIAQESLSMAAIREAVADGRRKPGSKAEIEAESRMRMLNDELNRWRPPTIGIVTEFTREARLLSGGSDYWIRPLELAARSFEANVFDALEAKGRRSDYLVHSVEGDRFTRPDYKGNPYPAGDERRAINAAMDDLLAVATPIMKNAAPLREATLEDMPLLAMMRR